MSTDKFPNPLAVLVTILTLGTFGTAGTWANNVQQKLEKIENYSQSIASLQGQYGVLSEKVDTLNKILDKLLVYAIKIDSNAK